MAIATSCAAAFIGMLCACTAPWLTGFFALGAEMFLLGPSALGALPKTPGH